MLDILAAVAAIERYLDRDRAAFESDELLQSWFLRHLQIIGEASRGLPEDVRVLAPEIPWSSIIGMRNILHCGPREGELLGLKWDDIDQSGTSATLQVKCTLSQTRTGPTFEKPKSGKGRSVKCSQKATEALRSHRTCQNQERLAAGPLWHDNDLVFPTLTGTTSGTNLLGRHFKPLLKRAELPPVRFHDLRHTCATILLMAGKHPKFVQELLGHASISITLDTYSHVIEGMDGGLADAMDDAL